MNRKGTVILATVIGSIGAVICIGGSAIAATTGPDDAFTTSHVEVSTTTRALVMPVDSQHIDALDDSTALDVVIGQPELRMAVSNSDADVFIGIGPAKAVENYLAGTNVDIVDDFDVDPFELTVDRRAGSVKPAPPTAQTFWVVKASGTSPTLDWKMQDGDYRVVVMNADATLGVKVDGQFTLTLPHLYGFAVSVLVTGAAMFLVALLLIGIRRRKPTGAGTPSAETTAWSAS
jgi:hypothetical protein